MQCIAVQIDMNEYETPDNVSIAIWFYLRTKQMSTNLNLSPPNSEKYTF